MAGRSNYQTRRQGTARLCCCSPTARPEQARDLMAATRAGPQGPAARGTGSRPDRPEAYLILSNIGKRQNFGTLLRSAAAFGVVEVLIVGEKKLKTFGNQGTVGHLKLSFYDDYSALRSRLKDVNICGIEITGQAAPVHEYPFRGSTAFMLGNEGVGMSSKQFALCEHFVYVPQYSKATASLNVAVAGAIVLQHFAVWAGFPETGRSGFKFNVERPRSALECYRNPDVDELEARRALQASRGQKKLQREDDLCIGLDALEPCGLEF